MNNNETNNTNAIQEKYNAFCAIITMRTQCVHTTRDGEISEYDVQKLWETSFNERLTQNFELEELLRNLDANGLLVDEAESDYNRERENSVKYSKSFSVEITNCY